MSATNGTLLTLVETARKVANLSLRHQDAVIRIEQTYRNAGRICSPLMRVDLDAMRDATSKFLFLAEALSKAIRSGEPTEGLMSLYKSSCDVFIERIESVKDHLEKHVKEFA